MLSLLDMRLKDMHAVMTSPPTHIAAHIETGNIR
jgi:hypothetical protein